MLTTLGIRLSHFGVLASCLIFWMGQGCVVHKSISAGPSQFGVIGSTPGTSTLFSPAMKVIQSKCLSCHQPGGSAPTSFVSYLSSETSWIHNGYVTAGAANQSRIYQYLQASGLSPGTMPLGGSLSTAELSAIQNWINALKTTTTPISPAFTAAMQVINNSCISCHTGQISGVNAGAIDFRSFVTNEGAWISAGLVVAGQPATSPLYEYLGGSGLSPGTMPFQLPALSAADLSKIYTWISQTTATGASTASPWNLSTAATRYNSAMTILTNNCVACHQPAPNGKSPLDFMTLIGTNSDSTWVAAGLVVQGQPSNSILFQALQGSGGFPGDMPYGMLPLAAADLNAISTWIADMNVGTVAPAPAPSFNPSFLASGTGQIGAPSTCAPTPSYTPIPRPIRRLSKANYNGALREFLSPLDRVHSGDTASAVASVQSLIDQIPNDSAPLDPSGVASNLYSANDTQLNQAHVTTIFNIAASLGNLLAGPLGAELMTGVPALSAPGTQCYINSQGGAGVVNFSAFNSGTDATGLCLTEFINYYGQKAFRRPLTAAETADYTNLYWAAAGGWGAWNSNCGGVASPDCAGGSNGADGTMVFAPPSPLPGGGTTAATSLINPVVALLGRMLASPYFYYEFDNQGTIQSGTVANNNAVFTLTDYELLSKITFLFWNAPPNDALYAQVAANPGLATNRANLEAVLSIVMADPRAANGIQNFYNEWLGLNSSAYLNSNSANSYINFTAGTNVLTPGHDYRDEMINEVLAMTQYYTFTAGGKYDDLMKSNYSFAKDADVSALYGVSPWDGTAQNLVGFPANQPRSGLLTRAALLTSGDAYSHPVIRGHLVRTQVLCENITPPPASVTITPLVQQPSITTRVAVERDSAPQTCIACHGQMNPLGYTSEHYDSLGRYRSLDERFDLISGALVNRLPVTATAAVGLFPGDTHISSDINDLQNYIAQTGIGQQCFTKQFFRYAYGRAEVPAVDACTLESMRNNLMTNPGASLLQMFRETTTQPAFMTRMIE